MTADRVAFVGTAREEVQPEGWYWADRAAGVWTVKSRVGVPTFENRGPMSETEYAERLNAVAPRAVDHKCLRGADLLAMEDE